MKEPTALADPLARAWEDPCSGVSVTGFSFRLQGMNYCGTYLFICLAPERL